MGGETNCCQVRIQIVWCSGELQIEIERQTERERDRQRERQAERQRYIDRERRETNCGRVRV